MRPNQSLKRSANVRHQNLRLPRPLQFLPPARNMKAIFVPFITIEDDDKDLIVSFAMGEHAEHSLTLLRTPVFESVLEDDERGVSVSTGSAKTNDRQLLVSISFSSETVLVETTGSSYLLSVRTVEAEEITEAKVVLRKMHFDNRFAITDA